jgi:hypothetical protein
MTDINETIVINGSKEAAGAIREFIDAQPGSQSHLTERKNIDGDTAAWIVIATLTGQVLPHVLGFIKDYLSTRQVKKIKVGDWEVENPTPEILERFLAMLDARSKQEKTSE